MSKPHQAHQHGQSYVKQRLSFQSQTCTVRYVGPLAGTTGTWLGVEWDLPDLGKHNGTHNGVRYFTCAAPSPQAGSFVRTTRPRDPPESFLAAVRGRYDSQFFPAEAAAEFDGDAASTDGVLDAAQVREARNRQAVQAAIAAPIHFGTKLAEEVGFEKVAAQQANLQGLRIVVLNGCCVAGLLAHDDKEITDRQAKAIEEVRKTLPRVVELDVGMNLIEEWSSIAQICRGLERLKILRISGNRLRTLELDSEQQSAFDGINELSMDRTLLSWADIARLASQFTSLATLSLASNYLSEITIALLTPNLTHLNLSNNDFSRLAALKPLSTLPNLTSLSLQSNRLTDLSDPPSLVHLTTLDLSVNGLASLTALDPLATTAFPVLRLLRVSRNPFSAAMAPDEAHMLVLARLPQVTALNYSPITPAERTNAELYYLSRIAAELATLPPGSPAAATVLVAHPQHAALAAKHDYTLATRSATADAAYLPGTLGARLVRLEVVRIRNPRAVAAAVAAAAAAAADARAMTEDKVTQPQHGKSDATTTAVIAGPSTHANPEMHTFTVPKTISIYNLRSLVGRAFGVLPVHCTLAWETGEWDPVGGRQRRRRAHRSRDSDVDLADEEEGKEGAGEKRKENESEISKGDEDQDEDEFSVSSEDADDTEAAPPGPGRFVRRRVPLPTGTSSIGFWIEGAEARLLLEVLGGS